LLASHAEGDEAQFYSIAMQIAAGEARSGHGKAAEVSIGVQSGSTK
jgi:hypothetical protein